MTAQRIGESEDVVIHPAQEIHEKVIDSAKGSKFELKSRFGWMDRRTGDVRPNARRLGRDSQIMASRWRNDRNLE